MSYIKAGLLLAIYQYNFNLFNNYTVLQNLILSPVELKLASKEEATKKALENAKGFLRSELARGVNMRKAPELKFKYDESLAYGNRIDELLAKINNK